MRTTHINALATRTNKWWVAEFSIDGREYGTQAHRLDLLEPMILDAAALMTGRDSAEFQVSLTIDAPQYSQPVEAYKRAAHIAREAEAEAAQVSRETVQFLRSQHLPMRDIGALMGISPQRVSQLAKAQ